MGTLFSYINLQTIIIIFLSIFFISCEGTFEPSDVTDSFLDIPIITGIIITGDIPDPLYAWGEPQYQSGVHYEINQQGTVLLPSEMYLYAPYPNPMDRSTYIKFVLPIETNVKIWIMKGKLPGDKVSISQNISGGTFFTSKNTKKILLIDKIYTAGTYEFIWDGKYNDQEVPAGFYRVYFEADGHLFWRDILIARKISDLPSELQDKIRIPR